LFWLKKVSTSWAPVGETEVHISCTIDRAELAAVLVAVQKGHTEIATDSASSLFQMRKQLLNPLAVLHHLHRELGHCEFNPILTFYCHFIQSEISLWYYWH